MREDLLRQVEQEFEDRRRRNEQEGLRRQREMADTHPDIHMLVTRREELIFGSMRGILQGGKADEDLPEKMEALSRKIREELKSAGYPEDYLAPVYDCPICRDTGYVGEPIRQMCVCMEKACRRKMGEALSQDGNPEETFEKYDETLFSPLPLEGHSYSQRQLNRVVRDCCERWAEAWPNQKPRDLLISGPSGLGKTYFLRAMAARLIERGCGVRMISAYQFLKITRENFFSQEDAEEELIRADVLMIDDLGSEPLMKNITIEQLFNVLNERQNRNLATVISTNLNMEELKDRYTERIASRLSDPATCNRLTLVGRDVRSGRE